MIWRRRFCLETFHLEYLSDLCVEFSSVEGMVLSGPHYWHLRVSLLPDPHIVRDCALYQVGNYAVWNHRLLYLAEMLQQKSYLLKLLAYLHHYVTSLCATFDMA